jgi:hypothetical protein
MMTLLRLSSDHVGPFLPGDEITFAPDVTVITGQNDAGKTALLALIERLAHRDRKSAVTEAEVSLAHRIPPTAPWKTDERIKAQAVFLADESQGKGPITVDYTLAPDVFAMSYSGTFKLDGKHNRAASSFPAELKGWPRAVVIPPATSDEIRTEIELDKMTPAEKSLLRIAFQKNIHAGEFGSLSRLERRGAVKEAEERLNERLSQFLPATLGYRFVLEPPSKAQPTVEIGLLDSHGGYSSLGQRGSGVRKMINLLGRLAIENIGSTPTLLLLDEPENSLHADSQHALRYALEQLGRLPSVQVIYATHSPAMINPMRPSSLRLLRRIRLNRQAWTTFKGGGNRADFATVRTSLGISPADSLLYSPVTIFVEGPTEVLCIPTLIRRLSDGGQPGFEGASDLLGNCLFVSVGGDHFGSQCTLAKAYGIIPVVYADGDKARQVRNQLARDHGDVDVITPDNPAHEAEHLVPIDVYFRALGKSLGKDDDDVNENVFNTWWENAHLPPQMMLSKRIGRWVEDTFDPNFTGKPEILHTACSEVAIELIRFESLERLVATVRQAIEKSVQPFFE